MQRSLVVFFLLAMGTACAAGTSSPRSPTVSPSRQATVNTQAPPGRDGSSAVQVDRHVVCANLVGSAEPLVSASEFACTPCVPEPAVMATADAAAHARLLWQRRGRAPYDSLERSAACVRFAWQVALDSMPGATPADFADATAFAMASVDALVRASALVRFDSLLSAMLVRGDSVAAGEALGHFSLLMWERTQLLLARPVERIDRVEHQARDLTSEVGTLRVVPPIPVRSIEFGGSEAEWCARLFSTVARLVPLPARSKWTRLALSPWVTMSRWGELDSAATAALLQTPNDSVAAPARALADYHRMLRPIEQQEQVHELFDAVLQSMHRVDSARINSFDHVLSRDDDQWRYGFLPSDRLTIEARGWLLLDPLWSTPVNEIRLARLARVLEADYRYANIAAPGESGSETAPGRILLRRGAPQARWTFGNRLAISARPPRFVREIKGGWRGINHIIWIDDGRELWRSFYSDLLLPQSVAEYGATQVGGACPSIGFEFSLVSCAEGLVADWTGVPFASGLDTIDVMVARFRGPVDSVDVHAEARLPLRAFRFQGAPGARSSDRIQWGLFIADALGNSLARKIEARSLPRSLVREWFGQWTARVATGSAMHRVEALEIGRPSGARGAMLFTSDSSVTIPLRGFGMSDLLIADEAQARTPNARRWTDFSLSPNAGVVRPMMPFAVLWEIYDLTPGPDGRVRWKIDIRREVGTRRNDTDLRRALTSTRTANAKVIANEPDASSLTYTREGPASSVVVETITMPLPVNASWGRHVVKITVTDLVSGKRATRSTGVRMLEPEAQRRQRRVPRN